MAIRRQLIAIFVKKVIVCSLGYNLWTTLCRFIDGCSGSEAMRSQSVFD